MNTCVVIDEQNVSQNTWIGGQFVWSNGSGPAVAAINATNGSNNRFIGINLASPGAWTAAGGAVGVLLDNRGVGNYLFGQVTVKPVSGDGDLIVDSATGNSAQLLFRNNGTSPWGWARDTSGNLLLIRYNPSNGASIDTPIVIEPSQGVSTFKKASLSGVGFFGAGVSTTRPTVSGSKAGNAALASLIQQLAALGLIHIATNDVDLLISCAEVGDADAQYELGRHCEKGVRIVQSWSDATHWYRKAADRGNVFALNSLAICYSKGNGVSQSLDEAVKLFRRAAEQGYATAQSNLAVAYANGYGVPQSWVQAASWFRRAAEQGQVDAQYNIGVCYADGYGVSHPVATAFETAA